MDDSKLDTRGLAGRTATRRYFTAEVPAPRLFCCSDSSGAEIQTGWKRSNPGHLKLTESLILQCTCIGLRVSGVGRKWVI